MVKHVVMFILSILCFFIGCRPEGQQQFPHYDMRDDLRPSRVTVAMWDFSWMYCHHPGGSYEDWDKVLDELIERGFNTVRIDAFVLQIKLLKDQGKDTFILPANPHDNWGFRLIDYEHNPLAELVEFVRLCERKGVYVILSTWNFGDRSKGKDWEEYWKGWEIVLDELQSKDLLDHVLYVDLDQEFPWFSPQLEHINELANVKTDTPQSALEMMEAAGQKQLKWNAAQMNHVKNYFDSSLRHFQKKYPRLRFTFSLTTFWEEVRAMRLNSFDVLELHLWMDLDKLGVRTDFDKMLKTRNPEQDYKVYQQQIDDMLHAIKPQLIKRMHNDMKFAKEWSEEIAAPVLTTEAWGPWWHMDHPDLKWQWLYDWCEMSVELSSEYGFWGTTPWNYSHPYWENWSNVEWYQKLNHGFLSK